MREKIFKILIVDDVPKNIQVIGNMLRKEKYDISFAKNGFEALKRAGRNDFDLILLDIMMPEMDGFEVCRKLKSDENTRDIPVIFLTAKTDIESIMKGFETGAVDYVTKPFNAAELVARVKTHLELRRSKEDLKKTNRSKDKFFSIIAHDLKNPLSGFLNITEVLTSHYSSFKDDEKQEFINILHKTSKQLYSLLENLLQLSRAQTGRIDYAPRITDLNEIITININLLKASASKKEITLINNIPERTIIFVDNNMITTVFRNLLSNAIKFSYPGSHVDISCEKDDEEIRIFVKDYGIGMNKKDMKKLFKIDQSLCKKGTANEKGTGIGLLLCKEFITRNHGRISANSEEGKGTTFIVSLPVYKK